MPTFYSFTENGVEYSFDDVFVPSEYFQQGNLWTWGRNNLCQLGDNTTLTKSTPVTIFYGGTNWKEVSCGLYHVGAIKTDGTLWLWGGGASGALGINTTSNRSTPVTTFIGGNDWRQISCSNQSTMAIKTDGTLWVWGKNFNGLLGVNDTIDRLTPVTTFAGGTNWKQISNGYHSAAIKTDGTLWVWGSNSDGQLGINLGVGENRSTPVTTFAGGNNWKQVSCSTYHTAAIKTDGTLWTWGSNSYYGQLGDNTSINKLTPVTTFTGGTNWKQVKCNYYHNLAIKTDGTLWCWGNNYEGQLGTNDVIHRSTPSTTFTGGTNWKHISEQGGYTSSAIKADGTLWCWGSNYFGSLGDNTLGDKLTPVTTFSGGNNWKQVSCGFGGNTAAIKYEENL